MCRGIYFQSRKGLFPLWLSPVGNSRNAVLSSGEQQSKGANNNSQKSLGIKGLNSTF